jgi:hypothetical protein
MIDHLDRQASVRQEPGQGGVSGLLRGENMAIKPEGFDETHRRSGRQHRLNGDEQKWKPYGIGDSGAAELKPHDPVMNGTHQNGRHHNGNGKSNGNGKGGSGCA